MSFFKLTTIPDWNCKLKEAEIIFLGIPLENTPTCRPGAKYGPDITRLAWYNIEPYFPDLDCCALSDLKVCDIGNLRVCYGDSKRNMKLIEKALLKLKKKNPKAKFLIVGGDHSIPYPVAKALKPKTVISFDAHLDFHKNWEGVKYTHTSQNYYIRTELNIDIVMVGIRSFEKEPFYEAKDLKVKIFTDEFNLNEFKDYIRFVKEPIYVTIDIDCLTDIGEHEIPSGGISMKVLKQALKCIFQIKKVIAADVCEVNPYFHVDKMGGTALTLVYYLACLFKKYQIG